MTWTDNLSGPEIWSLVLIAHVYYCAMWLVYGVRIVEFRQAIRPKYIRDWFKAGETRRRVMQYSFTHFVAIIGTIIIVRQDGVFAG